jgi:hypothetical protein
MTETHLHCACGKTHLDLTGEPILTAECCCTSCRTAGARMQRLPGAPQILTGHGGTPYVLYRKDRVRFSEGVEHLGAFRLSEKSGTRRIVATCCNTPVFAELEAGHWLSLYGQLWPADTRPVMETRTMTGDLNDRSSLPGDIANPKSYPLSFMFRLLGAWLAMGFRRPKIDVTRDIRVG